MLKIENLGLRFDENLVLETTFDLRLNHGQIALVVGETGTGKSTLLNALAGIFPTYTGGSVSGKIKIINSDSTENSTNFGYVFQNPFDGFVQNLVSQEIAFTNNQFSIPFESDWKNQLLDSLNINHLWNREVNTLSDGEAQRVAIAAALAPKPKFLLLDEPTSALDNENTKKFIELISRLVRDFNISVIVSEHRYEPLLEVADVVWTISNQEITQTSVEEFALSKLANLQIAQLSRNANLNPQIWRKESLRHIPKMTSPKLKSSQRKFESNAKAKILAKNLEVQSLDKTILKDISFEVPSGSVTAIMGSSGSGKSTLLHTLIGDHKYSGSLTVDGKDPRRLNARELLGKIALVPQQPGQLFVAETVSAECNFADKWRGLTVGTTLKLLDHFDAGIGLEQHPRDLSAGQQLWLAISIAIAANPELLLLDEPTRGLDHYGMCLLQELILNRRKAGFATVWATHDLDAAASISDNLLVLDAGKLISFGRPIASKHPRLKSNCIIQELYPDSEALSVQQLELSGTE